MQSTIRERASAAASRNMSAETTLWSKLKILAIKITRCGLSISSRLIVVYNSSLVEKEKEKEKKKKKKREDFRRRLRRVLRSTETSICT